MARRYRGECAGLMWRLERFPTYLHHRDCVRTFAGKERRAAGACLPLQASRRRPAGVLTQPLRGGPIVARCRVARRSRCFSIAPSSLLAPNQNRLRHGGADRSETALRLADPEADRRPYALANLLHRFTDIRLIPDGSAPVDGSGGLRRLCPSIPPPGWSLPGRSERRRVLSYLVRFVKNKVPLN